MDGCCLWWRERVFLCVGFRLFWYLLLSDPMQSIWVKSI